jgi:hypothetical protein
LSKPWRGLPLYSKARLLRRLHLERYRLGPTLLMGDAGLEPDPWQARLLQSWGAKRALLLCSRQSGKSSVAAALALREALLRPPALVLILSPTLRQSSEIFRDKLLRLYDACGQPVESKARTALSLELGNGSRVVSLPENEAGVRGFSGVSLLIIDEASRVDDALYYAVRPMLAVSGGGLLALSTPHGKRGWFYEEWGHGQGWERVKVTAEECPRISPEFLTGERLTMGERWYRQEFFCSFEDVVGQVFSDEAIRRAVSSDVKPLFG